MFSLYEREWCNDGVWFIVKGMGGVLILDITGRTHTLTTVNLHRSATPYSHSLNLLYAHPTPFIILQVLRVDSLLWFLFLFEEIFAFVFLYWGGHILEFVMPPFELYMFSFGSQLVALCLDLYLWGCFWMRLMNGNYGIWLWMHVRGFEFCYILKAFTALLYRS